MAMGGGSPTLRLENDDGDGEIDCRLGEMKKSGHWRKNWQIGRAHV